jgi:hypothetical protein
MVSNSYAAKRNGKSIFGVPGSAFPSDFVILHDTFCHRGLGAPFSREKQRDRLLLAYTNSDQTPAILVTAIVGPGRLFR